MTTWPAYGRDMKTDRQADRQLDRQTDSRQTDKNTVKYTDIYTDTQMDWQADRQLERQTDRQTHRHTGFFCFAHLCSNSPFSLPPLNIHTYIYVYILVVGAYLRVFIHLFAPQERTRESCALPRENGPWLMGEFSHVFPPTPFPTLPHPICQAHDSLKLGRQLRTGLYCR